MSTRYNQKNDRFWQVLIVQKSSVFFKNVIFRNFKFFQVFHYAPPSVPVCVTAPQIDREGTETLRITFLYKKRKITALNIKRLKRAFPFVLRGLVIFWEWIELLNSSTTLTTLAKQKQAAFLYIRQRIGSLYRVLSEHRKGIYLFGYLRL